MKIAKPIFVILTLVLLTGCTTVSEKKTIPEPTIIPTATITEEIPQKSETPKPQQQDGIDSLIEELDNIDLMEGELNDL